MLTVRNTGETRPACDRPTRSGAAWIEVMVLTISPAPNSTKDSAASAGYGNTSVQVIVAAASSDNDGPDLNGALR